MKTNQSQLMTNNDQLTLLYFVTRTGMYIHPIDSHNIVSFIHGYELGTMHSCDFTKQLKQLLSSRYKMSSSNDGWPGQIERLAKKSSLSWVITFKKIALELIAAEQNGDVGQALAEILRSRIETLIERINPIGSVWFNENWVEEWLSLSSLKSKWFKVLWSDSEWPIIESIDKEVQANNIFSDKNEKLPTEPLLSLKKKYDEVKST